MKMTMNEEISALTEGIQRLVQDNMWENGRCNFDPIRIKIALEFVKTEIEKSIKDKAGKIN